MTLFLATEVADGFSQREEMIVSIEPRRRGGEDCISSSNQVLAQYLKSSL